MAGIKKEPGPSAKRVAASLRRIRRANEMTTAGLSRRLSGIGYPIADTGITKAEQGTRRIDVDDLVPLALALGVTPNTLLMPEVEYLGSSEVHELTPKVSGSAERLWQWAQGERPAPVPLPETAPETGTGNAALEFTIRSRPHLTAPRAPGGDGTAAPAPELLELSEAIHKAMKAGATGAEIRRVTELTMALPAVMTDTEISAWLQRGTQPGGEGS
jgi:transcriptional regulator with XRE-family HTH domain